MQKVERVVVKNARGHAYHEIGEPLLDAPAHVRIKPLSLMSQAERYEFENIGAGVDLWPEVGSRMLVQVLEGVNVSAGGWIDIEPTRYRYALGWGDGVTVRTVIRDYLSTEVYWET